MTHLQTSFDDLTQTRESCADCSDWKQGFPGGTTGLCWSPAYVRAYCDQCSHSPNKPLLVGSTFQCIHCGKYQTVEPATRTTAWTPACRRYRRKEQETPKR